MTDLVRTIASEELVVQQDGIATMVLVVLLLRAGDTILMLLIRTASIISTTVGVTMVGAIITTAMAGVIMDGATTSVEDTEVMVQLHTAHLLGEQATPTIT